MGKPKVTIDFEAIRPQLEVAVAEALNATLLLTAVGMRAMLSKPGTGKVYRVAIGKRNGRNLRARGFHRASAPGNPPAVDTARLRNSWAVSGPVQPGIHSSADGFVALRKTGLSIRLNYGSTVDYAEKLEYGSGKVAPRPYVRPVLTKIQSVAKSVFERVFAAHFPEAPK